MVEGAGIKTVKQRTVDSGFHPYSIPHRSNNNSHFAEKPMDTRTADKADCSLLSSGDCLALARVMIVDGHPFFLFGITAIVEQEQLARGVKTVASIADTVEELPSRPETSLVLLDMTCTGESGRSVVSAS